MANSSKTSSKKQTKNQSSANATLPKENLGERLVVLDDTLKRLSDAVGQVSNEIKTLHPLLETTSKSPVIKAKPAPAPAASKPAPAVSKAAPVKKPATSTSKAAPVKKPATSTSKAAPVKTTSKAAPVKKPATSTSKAAPVKKPATSTSKAAPVKKPATSKVGTAKKAASKAKATASKQKKVLSLDEAFLDAVNTLPIDKLKDKLKTAEAKTHVINNIARERNKKNFQPFTSKEDLIERIKGVAEQSLELILEQWTVA